MKVLIVDDAGFSCHFYSRLIEKFGYTACTASSGHEALHCLRTDNDINIVLSDLMMRGMDGVDLFQEVQKLERYTDEGPLDPPKFILMTAMRPEKNSQDKDVARLKLATELDMAKVMFKPLDQKVLEQTLNDLAASIPKRSTSENSFKLQKTTQELQETVKTIIETDNSNAAENFVAFLNEKVTALKNMVEPI